MLEQIWHPCQYALPIRHLYRRLSHRVDAVVARHAVDDHDWRYETNEETTEVYIGLSRLHNHMARRSIYEKVRTSKTKERTAR